MQWSACTEIGFVRSTDSKQLFCFSSSSYDFFFDSLLPFCFSSVFFCLCFFFLLRHLFRLLFDIPHFSSFCYYFPQCYILSLSCALFLSFTSLSSLLPRTMSGMSAGITAWHSRSSLEFCWKTSLKLVVVSEKTLQASSRRCRRWCMLLFRYA